MWRVGEYRQIPGRSFIPMTCRFLQAVGQRPNYPAAGKAGIARLLAIEHHCPGLPEPGRSADSHAIDKSLHPG